MSRSYRKPYSAVTGVRSAADDKRVARRCWRRRQNQALRELDIEQWDEFLIPARYEASFNDVWSWGRDGKQYLWFLSDYYHTWISPITGECYSLYEDPEEKFAKLTRK